MNVMQGSQQSIQIELNGPCKTNQQIQPARTVQNRQYIRPNSPVKQFNKSRKMSQFPARKHKRKCFQSSAKQAC